MMKKIFVLVYLICISCHVQANNDNDTISNPQSTIYAAFLSCFQTNSSEKLVQIKDKLAKITDNQMRNYWLAYSMYYETLFYLKMGNRDESGKIIVAAITTVDTIHLKNSEIYALTAFLQNFSIQFNRGEMRDLSAQIKQNADKAIELDSTNIRAWYILGYNDMYIPAAFGGGKKCEKYFLKVISLSEQSSSEKYMPTWGKKDAYSALIGYYIGNEDFVNAKKYLSEALTLYPDDYMLNQQKEALK
jgi:tetratricopeptide (TPR) repeat protein